MNAPSTAELVLRMVLSLAIMGALVWLALRLGKGRRGRSVLRALSGVAGAGGRGPEAIEVCARRPLSRSSSLALVRVGERTLLLGVGEAGVQVLAEGETLAATDPTVAGQAATALGSVAGPVEPAGENVPGRAGTHAPRAPRPDPTRMGVVDALRELTVRR